MFSTALSLAGLIIGCVFVFLIGYDHGKAKQRKEHEEETLRSRLWELESKMKEIDRKELIIQKIRKRK